MNIVLTLVLCNEAKCESMISLDRVFLIKTKTFYLAIRTFRKITIPVLPSDRHANTITSNCAWQREISFKSLKQPETQARLSELFTEEGLMFGAIFGLY